MCKVLCERIWIRQLLHQLTPAYTSHDAAATRGAACTHTTHQLSLHYLALLFMSSGASNRSSYVHKQLKPSYTVPSPKLNATIVATIMGCWRPPVPILLGRIVSSEAAYYYTRSSVVGLCFCVCVCLSVCCHVRNPCKTADSIGMPFGMKTQGPRYHVLEEGRYPFREEAHLRGICSIGSFHRELDVSIVWNVHNIVFGSKSRGYIIDCN